MSGVQQMLLGGGGSQHWVLSWRDDTYGTDGDSGRTEVDAADGNIYSLGSCKTPITDVNALVVKFSSAGKLLWGRKLAKTGYGVGVSLAPVITGGSDVVCACNAWATATPLDKYFAVIKYDSVGTIQWQKEYSNTPSGAYVNGIAQDAAGNVYLSGAYGTACLLVKLNASGVIQWQKSLPLAFAPRIKIAADGYLYVAAFDATGTGYIIKLDAAGSIILQRSLSSPTTECRGITVDGSGNIYLATRHPTLDTGIVKLDSSGGVVWAKTLNFTAGAISTRYAEISPEGDIYVSGFGAGTGYVAKFSSDGSLIWQRVIYNLSIVSGAKFTASSILLSGDDVWGDTNILFNIPKDGSRTGTYIVEGNSIIYSASSFVIADWMPTIITTSVAASTTALSETAGGFTDSAANIFTSIKRL